MLHEPSFLAVALGLGWLAWLGFGGLGSWVDLGLAWCALVGSRRQAFTLKLWFTCKMRCTEGMVERMTCNVRMTWRHASSNISRTGCVRDLN